MKQKLLLFVAAMLISGIAMAQCADTANIYTFVFQGTTYEVVKQKMTWANAAACAVERGGRLAEINSEAEQLAIYDAIINGAAVSATYTTISNGGGIAYVWIGATDQTTEGTWLWDGVNAGTGVNFWTGQGANGTGTGASVGGAYHNWGGTSTGVVKEPDNFGNGQHHGAMALSGWPSGTTMLGIAGEWNDIIGTSQLYFVIEKDTTTGLRPTGNLPQWHLWPNPTHGTIFFAQECLQAEAFDLSGRTLSRVFNVKSMDLSPFRGEMVFIRITTPEAVWVHRVMVQ